MPPPPPPPPGRSLPSTGRGSKAGPAPPPPPPASSSRSAGASRALPSSQPARTASSSGVRPPPPPCGGAPRPPAPLGGAPRPPPPPSGGGPRAPPPSNLGAGGATSTTARGGKAAAKSGNSDISALHDQIHKGKKLKSSKHLMIDKSAPILDAGPSSCASSGKQPTNSNAGKGKPPSVKSNAPPVPHAGVRAQHHLPPPPNHNASLGQTSFRAQTMSKPNGNPPPLPGSKSGAPGRFGSTGPPPPPPPSTGRKMSNGMALPHR